MLKISTDELSFGEVAIHNIPSYRQLRIANLKDSPVLVHLSSGTPMIKFQFSNENFNSKETDSDSFSYNEAFDLINLVDRFCLEELEEREIIVLFKPEHNAFSHISAHSPLSLYNGTIYLNVASGGNLASDKTIRSQTQKDDYDTSTAPLKQSLTEETVLSESVSIPFSANVYLSLLEISQSEFHLTMAPNKMEHTSFSVTNISTCPLSFIIRNQCMRVKGIDLEIYKTGQMEEPKLNHRLLLQANSSMELSLVARTASDCVPNQSHRAILQCDNLFNLYNTAFVYVNINVSGEPQGDIVSLSSTSLNFGDIYRGIKTSAEIGFLNIDGRTDIAVSLAPVDQEKCHGYVALLKNNTPTDEVIVPVQKGMVYMNVQYIPDFDEEHKEATPVKFGINFLVRSTVTYRSQKVIVRCSAVLFTSTIEVTPTDIDLGDCVVGQSKRYVFHIINKTPLPGSVAIQIRSKVICIEGASQSESSKNQEMCEKLHIGPQSRLPITLRITPRRVNPTYRKQLTIVNVCNAVAEKQILNIEANNMPPLEAKLHNELYSWECHPLKCDTIDQEDSDLCAITDVPFLVPYLATSKVNYSLKLAISSTSPEIEIFHLTDPLSTALLVSLASELQTFYVFSESDYVKRSSRPPPKRVDEVMDQLLSILSNAIVIKEITLDSNKSVTVFALINRTAFCREPMSKEDGLTITVNGIETPRFVRLSYRLCSTSFELSGQKTKNFGEVSIGTKRSTMITIVNRCKSVLYIKATKSHSVTAGHIRIENSERESLFISVRPFAIRKIEVSFNPGIKGVFDEKISLENIFDPKNFVNVELKATVIKADTFEVSPDSWNFGNVLLPTVGDTAGSVRVGMRLTVYNTSKASRQIKVRLGTDSSVRFDDFLKNDCLHSYLGFKGANVKVQLDTELGTQHSASTRKIEEKIEKMEQKLKIYQRKRKDEKYKVTLKTIESLKKALLGGEVDPNALTIASPGHDNDFSESDDEAFYPKSKPHTTAELLMELLGEGVALPLMNAGESVNITFSLSFSRLPDELLPSSQTTTLHLFLFEARDKEVNRIVPIDITLMRPEADEFLHIASSDTPLLVNRSTLPTLELPKVFLEVCKTVCTLSTFMEYPLIVLHNCIVNDNTEFTLLVKSTKFTTVVVLEPRVCGGPVTQTLEARFKFFPRNGAVNSDEALRIMVECTARGVGPQKYIIPIKNLQNSSDILYVVVEINPTEEEEHIIAEPKNLTFRDIITPCRFNQLESQLLLIKSRFPYTHALLIRSNKPSQVLFFENSECTIPLETPIERTFLKETVRVYVKFVPSFRSTQGTSRVVSAGVIVEAITLNREGNYCTVGRSVVRLSVRVGSGIICVPKSHIEIGIIEDTKEPPTAIMKVSNISSTFIIRANVSTLSANLAIDGGNNREIALMPKEEKEIPVMLQSKAPGWIQEEIIIQNLSCIQEPIHVLVSGLRQDPFIFPIYSALDRIYYFPITVVEPGTNGSYHLHEKVSIKMCMQNMYPKDFILALKSTELPLYFSNDMQDGEEVISAVQSPNGCARLKSQRTQSVTCTLTGVPQLSQEQIKTLMEHRMVTINATAQVEVAQILNEKNVMRRTFPPRRHLPSLGQCLMLLTFTVPLTVSEGCAEPLKTDLGIIGLTKKYAEDSEYCSRYRRPRNSRFKADNANSNNNEGEDSSTEVRVLLRNLSPYLPLILRIECPPVLYFPEKRLTIPPEQTLEVSGNLQLEQITTQGPFRYQTFFVNDFNNENDISVAITGEYYWKIFQLKYRGNEDARETLSLSPLILHPSSTAPVLLSEEKFAVSVFVEEEVKLYWSMKYNPKVEGILAVQIFHYDATPASDSIVFPAQNAASPATISGSFDAANNSTASGSIMNTNDNNKNKQIGTNTHSSSTASGMDSTRDRGTVYGTTTSASNATTTPINNGRRRDPSSSPRTLTLRLRCFMESNDLAALASLFFWSIRKKQQEAALGFDKVPDLMARRTAPSNNIWIGNLTFANQFTDDEEYQVYGQIVPFSTFSAPHRVELQPLRIVLPPSLVSLAKSEQTAKVHWGYTGKLCITNSCKGCTLQLCLHVLISEHLSTPITVEVSGDSKACMPNEERSEATAENPSEGVPNEKVTVFYNNIKGSNAALDNSGGVNTNGSHTGHHFVIVPDETVVLDIALYSSSLYSKTDTNTTLSQLSLEQYVVFAVLDENVPCSVNISHVSVAPYDEEDVADQAPLALSISPDTGVKICTADLLRSRMHNTSKGILSASGLTETKNSLLNTKDATVMGVTPNPSSAGNGGLPDSPTTKRNAPTGSVGEPNRRAQVLFPQKSAQGVFSVGSSSSQVLSLKNCTPVPGIVGGYMCSFTIPKEGNLSSEILVCNNTIKHEVKYTVSIVSQTPIPWLLLLAKSGTLDAGESHLIRFAILSSKVGSFTAYLTIYNNVNPLEVLYLKLSADIFATTLVKDIFDVLASDGQSVATGDLHNVSLGHIYGSGTMRANIGIQIHNRGDVALEFPISVLKPLRLELRPMGDLPNTKDVLFAWKKHSQEAWNESHEDPQKPDLLDFEPQRELTKVASGSESTLPFGSMAHNLPVGATSRGPVFKGKVIACRIYDVPVMNSQRYIVVDPNSHARIAFVLSCAELYIPDGYRVHGEADVILQCKQVRDTRFVFRVTFELYQPTFHVDRVFDVPLGDDISRVVVNVDNLKNVPQGFCFRSQSPILYVVTGTGSQTKDDAAVKAMLTASTTLARTSGGIVRDSDSRHSTVMSFAELNIPENSSGYFIVMLDHKRAATLLSIDKGECEQVTLCEHAFILNRGNPNERVRIELRQIPLSDHTTESSDKVAMVLPHHSPNAFFPSYSPLYAVLKPIKVGRQHIGEHFIMRFVQRFNETLSRYSERLQSIFAYYEALKDGVETARYAADKEGDPIDMLQLIYDSESDEEEIGTTFFGQLDEAEELYRPDSTETFHALAQVLPRQTSTEDIDSKKLQPIRNRMTSVDSNAAAGVPGPPFSSTPDLIGYNNSEQSQASDNTVMLSPDLPFPSLFNLGHNAFRTGCNTTHLKRSPTEVTETILDTSIAHHGLKELVPPNTRPPLRAKEHHSGLPRFAWRQLHGLLVDMTWLVDELVFYAILLRNSRLIEGYCVFLTNAVLSHPVMMIWLEFKPKELQLFYKDDLIGIFSQYVETLDALPCPKPSVN
ncbi:unnamed protein product [Phytomonas sp. EM1]|nr:unnamed protein product [Phytomonas sp. EM1]|eukprot:CCW62871.1 unnamed protein product [Phytomonas sp. isolate EM1]